MGVELRRGVTVHWPGSVVLKGGGGELPRHFRCLDVADPRLGVTLELAQSDSDALAVRLPHPLITAD